ncbi:MAG: hypothetical protein K8R53_09355 [Bacteroidales bacterium]|nr:hypothetical protein [Bacteroidales bacterium]
MKTLIVKTDNLANATLLAKFLKSLQYVKSVVLEPDSKDKPLEAQDWAKPGRPATDKEIIEKLYRAENSRELSFEEAKEYTYKMIEKWQKDSK